MKKHLKLLNIMRKMTLENLEGSYLDFILCFHFYFISIFVFIFIFIFIAFVIIWIFFCLCKFELLKLIMIDSWSVRRLFTISLMSVMFFYTVHIFFCLTWKHLKINLSLPSTPLPSTPLPSTPLPSHLPNLIRYYWTFFGSFLALF